MREYPSCCANNPVPTRPISFVCVRFCAEIDHNLLKSTCVHDPLNQLVIIDNTQNLFFPNLGAALNAGINQAQHDLIALIHEDVILVDNWQAQFEASLGKLEAEHPNWGLVGSVGWQSSGGIRGHWSDPHKRKPVNTFDEQDFCSVARLDEQLLIIRRGGDIRPDPKLPSIHQLGIDLVHQQRTNRSGTFAINAPTIHKYADCQGSLIQTRTDSHKIMSRQSLTFQAGYDLSRAYLEHKHGLPKNLVPIEPAPQLSAVQQAQFDAPLILLGRGGGGTRLLSELAQNCGLFIGNEVNQSGDCIDMVPAIYRSVMRRIDGEGGWAHDIVPTDLRAAAARMLTQGNWPEHWGFKLPESALILPDLQRAFPRARYIYFSRDPEQTILRRSHMTARLDNEIGRASLKAAYDYVDRPRSAILHDETLVHMAITTRHQTDLIQAHLAQQPAEAQMLVQFEDTILDPMQALSRVSEFCGMPIAFNTIVERVNQSRSQPDYTQFSETEIALARHFLQKDV